MDYGLVTQLQCRHAVPCCFAHDGLHHAGDVVVKLGNPGRVVELVQISDQSAFFLLLERQQPLHIRDRLHRSQTVFGHQLPGQFDRNRAVHVLMEFGLRDAANYVGEVGNGLGHGESIIGGGS